MKLCPYTVSCIYAFLQQIYVQFCLELQIHICSDTNSDTLQNKCLFIFQSVFALVWLSSMFNNMLMHLRELLLQLIHNIMVLIIYQY